MHTTSEPEQTLQVPEAADEGSEHTRSRSWRVRNGYVRRAKKYSVALVRIMMTQILAIRDSRLRLRRRKHGASCADFFSASSIPKAPPWEVERPVSKGCVESMRGWRMVAVRIRKRRNTMGCSPYVGRSGSYRRMQDISASFLPVSSPYDTQSPPSFDPSSAGVAKRSRPSDIQTQLRS